MILAEVVARLRDHEAELRQLGVRRLFVFGSTVRGEARSDSDVDLFFEDDGTIGLFDVMDIGEAATGFLGHTADIRTRDSISRHMRPFIESEAVPIF